MWASRNRLVDKEPGLMTPGGQRICRDLRKGSCIKQSLGSSCMTLREIYCRKSELQEPRIPYNMLSIRMPSFSPVPLFRKNLSHYWPSYDGRHLACWLTVLRSLIPVAHARVSFAPSFSVQQKLCMAVVRITIRLSLQTFPTPRTLVHISVLSQWGSAEGKSAN